MTEVEMTVMAESPEAVTRALEAMARCAAGLALEQMSVAISADAVEYDTAADEEIDSV